jgi:hypothetical protein
MRPRRLAAAVAVAGAALVALLPRPARAQIGVESDDEQQLGPRRYQSEQRFAFELRFGPFRPDIDSEFSNRHPYQDFFGSGSKLLTQGELDFEVFHGFGTAAIGLGVGYFQASGPAPIAGTGAPSADSSTLKVVPFSVSAVYRFDWVFVQRGFPLVPYGKLGLDYAYWQITDGNGRIASDGFGGHGRGGSDGWHVSVGAAFILDMFDPEAARDFDADLGVNHTALVFELTHADRSGLVLSDRLHLGDNTWSLGLMMEF